MAGIAGSLSDIDAIEREMFDDYNSEGPKHKDEEEFYGEMLDDELLIEDYEPDLSDEDAKPATMSECSMFLVQHMIDDELVSSLMTPQRLIDYINMDDCHGESYEIFDCMSEFGKVKPLRYKGWQPRCLIEIVDETGKVILRGYGEDH